jgi:5-methylthioadenosine/S-adenosylhomocysteine deaminase
MPSRRASSAEGFGSPEPSSAIAGEAGTSRRDFVRSGALGLAAAVMAPLGRGEQAASQPGQTVRSGRNERILLKGGIVLTLDRQVGDFEKADVLIEGKKIAAVQPNLTAQAQVIDATNMIVMPGFVDTHHHQYETILRSILSNGILQGPKSYVSDIQGIYTPAYRPEDANISELVASLSQINAGVTTGVDTSQVSHTPEHTDACIAGLTKAGRRTLFAYSQGVGAGARYPQDIRRLRMQYFSSDDQLLTLAMGGGLDADAWALARQVGAPIVNHVVGNPEALESLGKAGLMGPDNEYIHCTRLTPTAWKMIADSGGKVSIATAIEMQMRHGMPPIQEAIDHGIQPSLSVDVETNMAADMFTVMRATFTLQRALVNERALNGEPNAPRMLTCRDVLEMATIHGARVSHLDRKIGTLTPGKEADIIMLRTDAINVTPVNDAAGAVVTLMDTSNVDTVFIAGKLMKRNGRLLGVDLPAIRQAIEKSRDAVLSRAGQKKDLFRS